jgi:hydroxymethylpyrimidine/phosphomethylpyrimidine kinase
MSSTLRYASRMTPIALTIAGSDCSAGAGLQADLKTFQHFQVYGLTAVTCVVSETPQIVRRVHPIPVDVMMDQVELLLQSFPIGAIKTGMLFSASHIEHLATLLAKYPNIPLVIDPVMIASTGDPLIEENAIQAYREKLLPLATLITPNLPEAAVLLDRKDILTHEFHEAAHQLAQRYQVAVLLKGGHLNEESCLDYLVEGESSYEYTSLRINTNASHGTGCTLSAAITANLALGNDLTESCASAKAFINHALASSIHWNRQGHGKIYVLNQGTVS